MRPAVGASILILLGSAAHAQLTTDWLDRDTAEGLVVEMRGKGMRLSDLDCRQNTDDHASETTAFRMSWEANDGGLEWRWREASAAALSRSTGEFELQGWRLVTRKSFITLSGEERSCALWYR